MPDVAYLEGLRRAGVDVGYLLTGERSHDPELVALQGPERYAAIYVRLIALQERLGVTFTPEEMAALGGYANDHCPTPEALESFVRAAYGVVGKKVGGGSD